MKIALIPPTPDLPYTRETGIHLLLSHLLEQPDYVSHYKSRRRQGDYLILDNSAHEFGVGNGHEILLRQAAILDAQEVVVPDVLFNYSATVEAARKTLRWITVETGGVFLPEELRLMLVPQGNTRREWALCLRQQMDLWKKYTGYFDLGRPVIGVSKDYDTVVHGGITSLITSYLEPLRAEFDLEVHCLGWPSNLWSLASVAREHAWVRSTDSAKPFVYAKAGILLEPGGEIPKYPRRDPEYFTEPLTQEQRVLAERNVQVFSASASNSLILGA